MNFYQVIVIGAGIAGLAAAKTLIDNGLQDVKILEGEQLIQFMSVHCVLLRFILMLSFHLSWSKEFFQIFLYQILYLFLIFSHIGCSSILSQSCFYNSPHISTYITNQTEYSNITIVYILIFSFMKSGRKKNIFKLNMK
jgi:hypothetical protein